MVDISITTFLYDVAFSYASEDRSYVKGVAENLRAHGVEVFYDEFKQVDTWGTGGDAS